MTPQPVGLFYSYSHKDEALRLELEQHLSMLKRERLLKGWHDRRIGAGDDWRKHISDALDASEVVLLLVSSDFLASDYCYEVEMQRAMERAASHKCRVIPIILRPCDWKREHLANLAVLPTDGRPVVSWQNRDEAWLDVVAGIRNEIEKISRLSAEPVAAPDRREYPEQRPLPPPESPQQRPMRPRSIASLIGVAAVVVGALTGVQTNWSKFWFQSRPHESGAAGSGGTAAAEAQFSSAEPAELTAVLRRGWVPIEAYLHPTLEVQNLLTRAETWFEARSAFDEACGAGPCSSRQRAAAFFARGQQALLHGQVSAARAEFEQAKAADETWALPLVAFGATWVRDDPTKAIENAREAHQRDPSLWVALLVKAAAFAEEKQFSAATQEYKTARIAAPDDCHSLIDALIAITYHAEGRREEKAKELATTACSGKNAWPVACAVLAERAIEDRELDAALSFVEAADRDDFVPLLIAQADAFQLKGDLTRAWIAWRRAADLKEVGSIQGAPSGRLAQIVRAVSTGQVPPVRLAKLERSRAVQHAAGSAGYRGSESCAPAYDASLVLLRDGRAAEALPALRECTANCSGDRRMYCLLKLQEASNGVARSMLMVNAGNWSGEELRALRVELDGQLIDAQLIERGFTVDPGAHVVALSAMGCAPVTVEFVVRPGEWRAIDAQLCRSDLADPALHDRSFPPANSAPMSPEGPPTQKKLALIAGGVGVVGVTVGVVSGLQALNREDPDAAHGFRTASAVGFIVGGLGLATGITLWLTTNSHPHGAQSSTAGSLQLGIGPSSVHLTSNW